MLKFISKSADQLYMSVIKPINFARMYLDQNRVSGSEFKRIEILVDAMKDNVDANQKQTMAPSKIQHIIDAGSTSVKVKTVLEGANDVANVALSPEKPDGPVFAGPLKKLNVL